VSTLARLIGKLLRPWPSLVVWIGLVFIASSVPLPEGQPVDFPVPPDRIAHVLAYALMAALAVRAVWRPGRSWWLIAAALLGAAAYGAAIEGWQALLGGRSSELGDGIANAIGAAIGGAFALLGRGLWLRRVSRRGDGGASAVSAYVERRARTRKGKEPAGHGEGQRRETH
jgi:VanZ family protein